MYYLPMKPDEPVTRMWSGAMPRVVSQPAPDCARQAGRGALKSPSSSGTAETSPSSCICSSYTTGGCHRANATRCRTSALPYTRMRTNIHGIALGTFVAVLSHLAVGNVMAERSPIEPARIFVVGLVQNCARYEVRPEDTFSRILARAGGEALESTDNEPQKPKVWPPLYVRISLKTAVDGKRTLSVPKRLWNEAVSKYAPLNNIIGIQFVAAY